MVSSFSSSSLDHSVFLIAGSSHSFHRALHCFAVYHTCQLYVHSAIAGKSCTFFASSEAHRAHWLRPYFEMAAFSTSSSTFDHCPTFVTTIVPGCNNRTRECVVGKETLVVEVVV